MVATGIFSEQSMGLYLSFNVVHNIVTFNIHDSDRSVSKCNSRLTSALAF